VRSHDLIRLLDEPGPGAPGWRPVANIFLELPRQQAGSVLAGADSAASGLPLRQGPAKRGQMRGICQ
jgi:hypothetical protein